MRIGCNRETCQTAYFPGNRFRVDEGMKCLGQIQKTMKTRPRAGGRRRDLKQPHAGAILERLEGLALDTAFVPVRPVFGLGLRPQAAKG